jgi:DNA replication and repair protein RecF
VLIVGENGAGKTNLLEAAHLATQGFSPRTRADAQLISFGEQAAAVSATLVAGEVQHRVDVRIARDTGKAVQLDGRDAGAEELRRQFPTLVFTPDRLSVIKGGPIVRRAYFDRVLSRLHPAQAAVPVDYTAALQQRNAALRRVQAGFAPRSALEPWTERVAALAAELVSYRRAAVASLGAGFSERLAEFGVGGGSLAYEATAPTREELDRRLEADLATGVTGIGPHRDDVQIRSAAGDLRTFGSQGQQRLALLALLLAEAALVPASPLVLLDDVLSELDAGRRKVLAGHVSLVEQTLITTTERLSLPGEPDQVVEVSAGQAH